MSKRENGIYVTHGKEMLVGYKPPFKTATF